MIENIIRWYLKKHGLTVVSTDKYILQTKQILVLPENYRRSIKVHNDIKLANIVLREDSKGYANIVLKNRWGNKGIIV